MNITILTYGSRGDVQPFLALALGLQKAGHTVKLVAPHRFADFVSKRDISFFPLAGDPEIISERLNAAGANPVGMVRAMSNYIFSIADHVVCQIFSACDDADLIIHSFLFTTGGHSLARKLNIPDISVQTFPIFAHTRAFPPVSMPGLPPGLLSYFGHWLHTQIFWHGGNLGYGQLRKRLPGTFNLNLHWPFAPDNNRIRTPLILACSSTIIPRPDDWSAPHIHIPGYFFLDELESYQPSSELADFLSAGEPPVCVTFGSTIHKNPRHIYSVVLAALEKTGNRAILLSGWSDLQNLQLPESVFAVDAVPHSWLLPQCKAVIHHGGAGTIAAGLRAGVPAIIVPSASDQPFWGARVYAVGAGPQPIPIKKLTVEKLVTALVGADEKAIRKGAQAVGMKIREENGVGQTIKLVEDYVVKWRESPQSTIF
jgi:UDP:flavonoid glycosyltransferase YjiC (YdhE family)